MVVVIGSGPAGVASATALLEQGLEVTLLDAGVEMEPERRAMLESLARSDPGSWPAQSLEAVRRQPPIELGGVPLKYSFGSDFPYRDVERLLPFENPCAATDPHFGL